MLVVIFVSFLGLAIDSPLNDPTSNLANALLILDYVTTSIFILEAVLKIIASGLINCGSTSYLKSYGNLNDLAIIAMTVTSYFVPGSSANAVKVFRLLKVLRPIRLISRNENLQVAIQALGKALGGIITIITIMLIFCFVFGVIGINYFKGRLFYCKEGLSPVDTKWDCLNLGGRWANHDLNFDNIANAISSMLVISNAVQWTDAMYAASFARGVDLEPGNMLEGSGAPVFFIVSVIIGNFFIMNLFMGVIITAYNRENEIGAKDFMLTEKQHKWVLQKIMII